MCALAILMDLTVNSKGCLLRCTVNKATSSQAVVAEQECQQGGGGELDR